MYEYKDKMDDLGNPGTLAALNLLRSYNHFMLSADSPQQRLIGLTAPITPMRQAVYGGNFDPIYVDARAILAYQQQSQTSFYAPPPLDCDKVTSSHRLSTAAPSPLPEGFRSSRRGEKRPIPDEQKDDRYFERRKRNNQAAKKSRDARKIREDQIALRACVLEHENAALRAQLLASRNEATSLRRLLVRTSEQPTTLCLGEIISSTTIDMEE